MLEKFLEAINNKKLVEVRFITKSDGQIQEINVLESESFDPADYIKWEPNWIFKRDWGVYS